MGNNDGNNQRIARNSIFMTIRMVIVLCITLYTTRVIIHVLGIEDYGIYNVVCGFVSLFSFLNTAMANGIQRFYNFELGRSGCDGATRVFNTALRIQIILAISVFIIVEILGIWYISNKMVIPNERLSAAKYIFQFATISFLFSIIQSPFSAAVLANERMDFYAIINVVDTISKLGIVIILPYFGIDKLVLYGALLLLISVLNLVVYAVYTKSKFPEIRFERTFDRELFKSMLGFSGWNFFGAFSNLMKDQGINIVLNLFFGPVVNAARGVANQVSGGLQSLVSNLSIPVRPQVIQSYAQGNIDRTFNLTYSISKITLLCFYALSVPILFELNYILSLWLGQEVPEHTSSFVLIVILTAAINNLNAAISGVVHASGKMKTYQLSTSMVSLCSVPVAYILLKNGSMPEIALWAVFAFTTISQIVSVIVLRSIVYFRIWDYLKNTIVPLAKVMLLSLWVPILLKNIMDDGLLRFIILSFVSECIIICSILYFGLNSSERNLVLKFIRAKIHKK